MNAKHNREEKKPISQQAICYVFGRLFRVNFPRRNISIHLYCLVAFLFIFTYFFFIYTSNWAAICVRAMPVAITPLQMRDATVSCLWSYNFCRTFLLIPLAYSVNGVFSMCVLTSTIVNALHIFFSLFPSLRSIDGSRALFRCMSAHAACDRTRCQFDSVNVLVSVCVRILKWL